METELEERQMNDPVTGLEERYAVLETAIGRFYAVSDGQCVRAVVRRLPETATLDRLPESPRFDLSGLTEFERAVLEKTLEIPPGQVRSYAWVAREIGRPRAVRAVGSALARNPIPVLIPCHRVVRSDGVIGQYGAGGTAAKRAILESEGVDTRRLRRLEAAGVPQPRL